MLRVPMLILRVYLVISATIYLTDVAANKSIFILAGQSNMSGRGGVVNLTWDQFIPRESSSNPAILRLAANLTWELAIEPIHRDIDVSKVCGVGPGMAFANSLLKQVPVIGVVGLVPCAIGGTNINEWVRGGVLYNQMMGRIRVAVKDGGIIRGLLWYQGESDTLTVEDARAYNRRLHNFFVDVRADLHIPHLPIVQVALASISGPYTDMVREAQLGMKLVNLKTVDAMGLSVQEPERLHLTTPAQVSLGNMLTNAFLSINNEMEKNTSQFIGVGTVANAAPSKSIFLLAGQSNMSGRGGVINNTWDNYIPPECTPNLSILRLSADLNWQLATEPLHRDIDTTRACGIGPGMVFASSLLQKDSSIGVVGLVPCAVGGTNISEWAQGGELYKQLIKRAEAALEGGGIIRGLLWYQGESDTVNREDAEAYKMRLQNFFLHVRADLLLPVLPVIQVALASGEGPYVEMVREAQLGMDLINLRTVDANGLSLEPDGLHLTTPSQVSLGKMLANAFLQSRPSSLTSNSSSKSQNVVTNLLGMLFFVQIFYYSYL
ncbi:acetylesterase [Artemisia annua]|uniref:Acetylesterase n=1 Tax=Artemisia annua TaxID=35608 RepID=A0A2U1MAN0_ARTAN|nr:acetylesterase [Artemisia annua]